MTVLADAAGIAKSLASSDAGHHRGGQTLRHQRRTLLDVQLQVGADPGRIEKRPPLANRPGIETALDQGGFKTAAIVRARYREAGRVEQSECPAAAEIRNVEPGGLFRSNAHDRDIAGGRRSGASEC